MLGIILRVLAFLLFLFAGFHGTIHGYGELDLIAFALAAWVLATILGGWGPNVSINRN